MKEFLPSLRSYSNENSHFPLSALFHQSMNVQGVVRKGHAQAIESGLKKRNPGKWTYRYECLWPKHL
jgi:hypothetical protein